MECPLLGTELSPNDMKQLQSFVGLPGRRHRVGHQPHHRPRFGITRCDGWDNDKGPDLVLAVDQTPTPQRIFLVAIEERKHEHALFLGIRLFFLPCCRIAKSGQATYSKGNEDWPSAGGDKLVLLPANGQRRYLRNVISGGEPHPVVVGRGHYSGAATVGGAATCYLEVDTSEHGELRFRRYDVQPYLLDNLHTWFKVVGFAARKVEIIAGGLRALS
mmetsp:Transcript_146654/g.255870  ORF Transcript_146654/g.255870 Transcript_146654/m.255870 type:complete len:217 (-) Transcript_146654:210-860(-)